MDMQAQGGQTQRRLTGGPAGSVGVFEGVAGLRKPEFFSPLGVAFDALMPQAMAKCAEGSGHDNEFNAGTFHQLSISYP